LNLALKKKQEQSKPLSKDFAVPLAKKPKLDSDACSTSGLSSKSKSSDKKKSSALDDIIKEEERRKENAHRKPNWITEVGLRNLRKQQNQHTLTMHFLFQGIVVKVITKALGDKYHNEKGHIVSLVDKFTAIVQMLNSKAKIKFDQSHLETVIPAVGM